MNDQEKRYQLFINFTKDIYNDQDENTEPLNVINAIVDHINDILENNINEVIFKTGFNDYDLYSYDYNINDIYHALNILLDYDYFDLFKVVKIYDYNTGYLYRNIKGAL